MGAVIQFAFWGIEKFSKNTYIDPEFIDEIKPQTNSQKFCIGRLIDDIPIGLIIYAGRNQAIHFDDEKLHPINKKVFHKLANWYSPSFQKWFVNDAYELENPNILNYAEIITYKLGWTKYETYESDMLHMLGE
jgi:hypothetical protein